MGPETSGDRQDGAALLDKACDVIDAIGSSAGGLTQTELATRLGLSRSTLYRILAKLTGRGLLRQDLARRAYMPGFQLLDIAQGAWAAMDLPMAAAGELRHLRDATGETAYVAVREGREVVGVGRFDGAHPVRSAAQLGRRKPLHCTSQGKAILAFLSAAEREALLDGMAFEALTARTLTDADQLLAHLREVRARGFSTDNEEIVEGVRCVGAPVLTPDGQVRGAISIAGPAWRMTVKRLELLGPEMAAAGRRIGAQLRPAASPAAAEPTGEAAAVGPVGFRGFGPVWGPSGLWWGDALAPALHVLQGARDRTIGRWDGPLRALAPAAAGAVLVLDAAGGLFRASTSGDVEPCGHGPALASVTALAVHPDGTLWAGASAEGEASSIVGPLRRDGTVESAWRLPGPADALAWDAAGDALFATVGDSGTLYRLDRWRPGPRVLARLPAGGGRPSGLAVDVEGGVWTALHDGWGVARIDPDGAVDRTLPLPVPRPTDLCFGGRNGTTLYVTTARDGVPLDALGAAPLSGRVLALDGPIRGVLVGAAGWT